MTGRTTRGTVAGTARLGVIRSGVSVTPEHLTVGGVSAGALAARFTVVIPVRALPLHLSVTGVRAAAGGLVVAAAAHDVAFAGA